MNTLENPQNAEDDSMSQAEINRMMRENKKWAIEALWRVGATVDVNPHNPDEVTITATKEQITAAKNEKPPFLYHGSQTAGLETFETRSAPERPNEPPLVYASPDLRAAEMSMLNGPEVGGGVYDGNHYAYIIEPREVYLQRDQMGHIYKFANDTFQRNKGIGLGDQEWVSEVSVAPLEVVSYPSKLDKVIERGIMVYFVTPEQAKQIEAAQDDSNRLKQVLGNLESENELRDNTLS